jgi:hypothetical protein
LVSEVNQVQKAKGHVFSHMWIIGPTPMQATLYIHTNIYRTYTKSGTGRGEQGRKKEGKKDNK